MMHLEHAMHHPMIVHFTLLLIACLSFVLVCSSGLDDDVEAYDTFVYPTEEFVQYQATDLPGKYHLLDSRFPVHTGYVSFRCLSC